MSAETAGEAPAAGVRLSARWPTFAGSRPEAKSPAISTRSGFSASRLRHDARKPAGVHRHPADMHVARVASPRTGGSPCRQPGAPGRRGAPPGRRAHSDSPSRRAGARQQEGGEKEQETAHRATLAGPPADASTMMLAEPLAARPCSPVMRAFADLLDRLIYTRSRNAKLKLIADYLVATPDPDRGWAMAALTGDLDLPAVKPAMIRALVEERVDPVLFRMSRDFVGDSAETVALLWPAPPRRRRRTGEPLTVSAGRRPARLASRAPMRRPRWRACSTGSTPTSASPLLKMATGALRIGVSARLAKTAPRPGLRARRRGGGGSVARHRPALCPAVRLGRRARGSADRGRCAGVPPFMLAHPLEDLRVGLDDYAAEWKWDGIRVQIVHVGGETRLYSRAGDDITGSFPEVARDFATPGVLDGELMVKGEVQGAGLEEAGGAASFNALQQRLGRKIVSAKMLADYPAFVRLYDILFDGAEDLRALPWSARRPAGWRPSRRSSIPSGSTSAR